MSAPIKVLRVYHAGRDAGHRVRERALVQAGVEVTLVVPSSWPDPGAQRQLSTEPFEIIELDVARPGDVNRHRYADPAALAGLVARVSPDLLDLHEEPVSVASRQWLRAAGELPVVMYTAQNIDKRFPPPFAQYERAALRRVQALYPCSRQAARVARGKGFGGRIDVLPLGMDAGTFAAGSQTPGDDVVVLGLVGRMVAEKGVTDAVHVLAAVRALRPARLELIGTGPELEPALELAAALGVRDHVAVTPWVDAADLAKAYQGMHLVLVPSRATATWVEQFGRVVLEGQAGGAVVAGYASGTIPEVSGGAAVLVPEGDAAALAAAVRAVVTDPVRWANLRERGLANAAAAAWPRVATRQAELYARALDASPGASPALPALRAHARRVRADAEFGSPASVLGQTRPFALPILRNPSALARVLGRMVDVVNR